MFKALLIPVAVLFGLASGVYVSGKLAPGPTGGFVELELAIDYERLSRIRFEEALKDGNHADFIAASRASLRIRDYEMVNEIGRAWIEHGGGLPALRMTAGTELRFARQGAALDVMATIAREYGPDEVYRTIAVSLPAHNFNPRLGETRIKAMRDAHADQPHTASYHAHLALVLSQAWHHRDARAELARALEKDENDYASRWLQTVLLFDAKKIAEAIAQSREMAGVPAELASESLARIMRWKEVNRIDKLPLPKAAEDLPADFRLGTAQLVLLSSSLARNGSPIEQIADIFAGHEYMGRKAIEAYRIHASVLRDLNRIAELEKIVAQAIATADIDHISAYARFGTAELMRAGVPASAYLILAQSQHTVNIAPLLELAGRYGHASGNTAAAAALVEQSVAKWPKTTVQLSAAGFFFADSNYDLERAAAFLDQIAPADAGKPAVLLARGWLAYRLGNLNEAEQLINDSLRFVRTAAALSRLAEVRWQQGEHEGAIDLLKQAAQADSGDIVMREVANRLGVTDSLPEETAEWQRN